MRKTLLTSLKETVEAFKERKTVGRMKTEHSIFIPSSLMEEKEQEIEEFIKAAKYINKRQDWFCPVSAEKLEIRDLSGIEFVLQFSADTRFDEIIQELDNRIA